MFPTPFLGLARLAGQVLWASRAPSKVETAPARKSQLNSLSDRLAAIYQIRVSPNKLVAYTSQVVGFSAVGSDAVAEAVQGPEVQLEFFRFFRHLHRRSRPGDNVEARTLLDYVQGRLGAAEGSSPCSTRPPARSNND